MTDQHPPPNPQEPKRTGQLWLDMAVALSALLISVTSIFVAYNSNQSMERLTRASSWPFLQLGSGNASDDGAPQLEFSVSNVGTGPARVYTFNILVDGRPLPPHSHTLTQLLEACCAQEFASASARAGGRVAAMGFELSQPVARRFLAPNSEIVTLRWPRTPANEALWRALDDARQTGRITMRTCYCSVFDDCWIAHSDAFPPETVRSCPNESPRSGRPAPSH